MHGAVFTAVLTGLWGRQSPLRVRLALLQPMVDTRTWFNSKPFVISISIVIVVVVAVAVVVVKSRVTGLNSTVIVWLRMPYLVVGIPTSISTAVIVIVRL